MLSEIDERSEEHKCFATFANNLPSLRVYGPLPLSISVYLLIAGGVPSPMRGAQAVEQAAQCHRQEVSLYLREQSMQGQAPLRQSFICATRSSLEIWREAATRQGGQGKNPLPVQLTYQNPSCCHHCSQ